MSSFCILNPIMIFQPSPSSPDNNGSAVAGVSEGYSLYQDAF